MAKKKKKLYAWFYTLNNSKPDAFDMEHPYRTEKQAMIDALSDLDIGDSVSVFKAEIKKVGTYKQKLTKV